MKPMSFVACGIVISSLGVTIPVQAESPSGNFALRADTEADMQAWKKEPVRSNQPAEPAPRGDLRGDIASNVHTRPEPERGARPRRH
ncbi:MAG: hypothetical protein M3O74_24560 [Pseudomonadota bacterium]|jgi:hypothetical protein|uniref:Uncharacterized protein n=1 Tax=Caballeronia sordidicola TaxID=196367 RepID=A0A242MMD0_CABSO|nr:MULTISPECIES: hypothetical protein [Burkholderiaceae]AMM14189.1 hypothetical protein AX768_08865 [Burkholderia sp. PAMC 28687]MDP9157411.1 hypothetical protein [Pseudomonadota bacterium]OTP72476.1 hypothetical protein PAMC26510_21855 [Caballeronia sordidicola]